jgi:hypothetical protein
MLLTVIYLKVKVTGHLTGLRDRVASFSFFASGWEGYYRQLNYNEPSYPLTYYFDSEELAP